MGDPAKLLHRLPPPGAPAEADHLGPACVLRAGDGEVHVRLEGGADVTAQLALALPYVPAEGDVVLVIGKHGRCYVIGVIHGRGHTSLSFRGDVSVQAVGGSLRLGADEGVTVEGRRVELRAGELKMVAGDVVQKFQSVYQRVRTLLSVHAEHTHTIVDKSAFTKAESASIVTEQTMSINGKQIHLG